MSFVDGCSLRAGTMNCGRIAAVGVDAQDLQVLAAVAARRAAGEALLAVHVRLDRAAVAGPHVRHAAPTARTSTPSSCPGMRG